MPTVQNTDEKICCICHKTLSTKKFYNSKSILDIDGLSHVCKVCTKDLIDIENMDTVFYVLMALNLPFDIKYWKSAKEGKGDTFGNYIRMTNSLTQLRDKTWNDSDFGDEVELEEYNDDEIDENMLNELKETWGDGFKIPQYLRLQKFYNEFTKEYESDSPAQRLNFRNAARTQLQAEEALAKNDTDIFNKLMATLSKILGDSNVKPVQETGSEASDQLCFGLFLKKWETEKPVYAGEVPDAMKEYIDTWMVGHLAKMEGMNNELVDKYNEALKPYSVEFGNTDESGDEE